jgi:hypothetical protein
MHDERRSLALDQLKHFARGRTEALVSEERDAQVALRSEVGGARR